MRAVPARLVLAADHPAVARALGEAFGDDPLISWLVAGTSDGAEPSLLAAAFFVPGLRAGQRRGHSFVLEDSGPGPAGAAIWSPPDSPMFRRPEGEELAAALVEHGAPGGLDRLAALAGLTGDRHPTDAHFYLFALGLVPRCRSRGLGPGLITPVLARCDADGLPAYLESSNPRNVTFYQRHGFDTVWEDAPQDGPSVRGMRRDPRPPS